MFEWLEQEIATVKTPGFFVVDGPADKRLREAVLNSPLALPDSYKEFVLRFGNAKLYRQPQTGAYWVGVLASPHEATLPDGQMDYQIGHFDDARAYVRAPEGDWHGGELPILEWHSGHKRKIADSFWEWLRKRCAKARKGYTTKEWEGIVRGPEPFSPEELSIVDARRKFRWRMLGVTANGNLKFAVMNDSERSLPALSLGVRSKDGRLNGKVFLPVTRIRPGEAAQVERPSYKQVVPAEELEVFELPDPAPWNKDEYAEFGGWNLPAPAD